MQRSQMALLLDRLFTLEGKPVKERTAEEKAEINRIRLTLAAELPRILTECGIADKDKVAYAEAVLEDHE